jgi:hypothetical protein
MAIWRYGGMTVWRYGGMTVRTELRQACGVAIGIKNTDTHRQSKAPI